MTAKTFWKLFSFVVLAGMIVFTAQAQELGSVARRSQSSTLLPDGGILLLGGFDGDGRPLADAVRIDRTNQTGKVERLTGRLQVARAGHTATVLPDGTVL